ncbi:MAG: AtpZ/AtpI family protein [Bacteroidota bacterium]
MEEPDKNSKKKPPLNNYAKYSAMGFQMAAIIALGVWGGRSLDSYFQTKFPAFTLILSLLSVVGGIYWAVKDIINKK